MRDLRTNLSRALRTAGTSLVALLALMTAAYAATGDLPLDGSLRDARPARAALSSTAGLQQTSVSGVTWTSGNIVPGDAVNSQITVTNSGTSAAAFSLTPSGLTDEPAAPAQTLSSALRLRVQDVTNPAAAITIYDGTLADFTARPLGNWQPGESHAYRFTTTFPLGRPDALDNQLQDATSTIRYSWGPAGVQPARGG